MCVGRGINFQKGDYLVPFQCFVLLFFLFCFMCVLLVLFSMFFFLLWLYFVIEFSSYLIDQFLCLSSSHSN